MGKAAADGLSKCSGYRTVCLADMNVSWATTSVTALPGSACLR